MRSSDESLKGLLVLRIIDFVVADDRLRWSLDKYAEFKKARVKEAELALREVCQKIHPQILYTWSSVIHNIRDADAVRLDNIMKDYWISPEDWEKSERYHYDLQK